MMILSDTDISYTLLPRYFYSNLDVPFLSHTTLLLNSILRTMITGSASNSLTLLECLKGFLDVSLWGVLLNKY